MRITVIAAGMAVAIAVASSAWSQETPAAGPAVAYPPRTIITWVPPYDRATALTRLAKKYTGVGPFNSLTHLGLQFWKPTATGGIARVTSEGVISNAEIARYVKWAHNNGIKVMLTVYNGDPTWDWALAKSAFGAHRAAFVAALVAEMQARGLDGVDVDLEGPDMDPTADDKAQYLAFVKALSAAVHAKSKRVHVDSFHYIYNAPNQTWWKSLFPYVDGLVSMGYEDLGRNAPTWQAYAAQRKVAGSAANMSKLILGVPSYLDTWQGNDSATQIQWFVPAAIRTGIGIWDARDTAASWQAAPVWSRLHTIRGQNP